MSVLSNIARRSSDYDDFFGFIYIINSTCLHCQERFTKIGKADAKNYKSTRFRKRIKNYFTTEYPAGFEVVTNYAVENYNEAERRLHEHFDQFRVRGEWFNFNTEYSLEELQMTEQPLVPQIILDEAQVIIDGCNEEFAKNI